MVVAVPAQVGPGEVGLVPMGKVRVTGNQREMRLSRSMSNIHGTPPSRSDLNTAAQPGYGDAGRPSPKSPPDLSRMQTIQWKKQQQQQPQPQPLRPTAPAAQFGTPPPGLSVMQTVQWKKQQADQHKQLQRRATFDPVVAAAAPPPSMANIPPPRPVPAYTPPKQWRTRVWDRICIEVARVKFSLWSKHCTVFAMWGLVVLGVLVPVMEHQEAYYLELDGGRVQAARRSGGKLGQSEVYGALMGAGLALVVLVVERGLGTEALCALTTDNTHGGPLTVRLGALVVESVIQVALVPVWLGLWLLVPPIILTLLAMGRGEKDMVFPRGHIQRKQTGDEDK